MPTINVTIPTDRGTAQELHERAQVLLAAAASISDPWADVQAQVLLAMASAALGVLDGEEHVIVSPWYALPDQSALERHSWLGDDNEPGVPDDADISDVAQTIYEHHAGQEEYVYGGPEALEARIREIIAAMPCRQQAGRCEGL